MKHFTPLILLVLLVGIGCKKEEVLEPQTNDNGNGGGGINPPVATAYSPFVGYWQDTEWNGVPVTYDAGIDFLIDSTFQVYSNGSANGNVGSLSLDSLEHNHVFEGEQYEGKIALNGEYKSYKFVSVDTLHLASPGVGGNPSAVITYVIQP